LCGGDHFCDLNSSWGGKANYTNRLSKGKRGKGNARQSKTVFLRGDGRPEGKKIIKCITEEKTKERTHILCGRLGSCWGKHRWTLELSPRGQQGFGGPRRDRLALRGGRGNHHQSKPSNNLKVTKKSKKLCERHIRHNVGISQEEGHVPKKKASGTDHQLFWTQEKLGGGKKKTEARPGKRVATRASRLVT